MSMVGKRFRELSAAEKCGQVLFWMFVVAIVPLLLLLAIVRGLGKSADCAGSWLADDRRWFNKFDRVRW